MKKEHFEILLEDINSKFNLILEGYDVLRSEIRQTRDESNVKHDHSAFLIDTLNKKIDKVEANLSTRIDAVGADLTAHRADTEAHHGIYRVKESD